MVETTKTPTKNTTPNAFPVAMCFRVTSSRHSITMKDVATTIPSQSGGVVGRSNSDINRARRGATATPALLAERLGMRVDRRMRCFTA
jgi:hypothetical protein